MCPDVTVGPGSTAQSLAPGPANGKKGTRDAVIWVSGLTEATVAQSLERTARRIAVALDNSTPARENYTVEQRDDGTVPVCTIVRADDQGTWPIIDVFGLAVEERLVGPVRRMVLWKQACLGGGVVAGAVLVLVRRLRGTRGKTSRERIQLLYAIGLFALMALGLLGLAGALVVGFVEGNPGWLPKWLSGVILVIGGFAVWKLPVFKRLRAASLTLYAVYRYIKRADGSGPSLRGALANILDVAQNYHDCLGYGRIVVLSYSFGSLAALDACFSPTAEPPARLEDIDQLVTIGCPFDLIRAFFPDYAAARHWRVGAPGEWINVYAPSDVLSSNFRDDPNVDKASVRLVLRDHPDGGIAPTNMVFRIDGRDSPAGLIDTFLMRGLKFHGRYWNDADDAADSVFGMLVPKLFASRPALP
jgi:hypothetical protein